MTKIRFHGALDPSPEHYYMPKTEISDETCQLDVC